MSDEHILPAETLPYFGFFVLLAVVAAILFVRNASTDTVDATPAFKSFQRDYLIVYWIMQFADWLQGPYIYALYSERGFSQGEIGVLFVAGFGSALVLGTIAGSLADKTGRRLNCLLFAVIYSLSCMMTHSDSFEMLLIGRILGGISGSILNTAFEAWMVAEHNSRGFPGEWLNQTFSVAIFGSGIAAILAGLVATPFVSMWGATAPFDISATFLVIGGVVVLLRWNENYGESSGAAGDDGIIGSFTRAVSVLRTNSNVAMVGMTQSLFEAAMYIFVFFWTPALEASLKEEQGAEASLPHGLIFACFMVSVMIGSKLYESISRVHAVETWGFGMFAIAALSLFMAVILASHWVQVFFLCVFELCCGCYFALMGKLRSKYIPEEVRSTLMNLFRVGINVIVLAVLSHAEAFGEHSGFLLCAALLSGSVLPQLRLRSSFTMPVEGDSGAGSGKGSKRNGDAEDEQSLVSN